MNKDDNGKLRLERVKPSGMYYIIFMLSLYSFIILYSCFLFQMNMVTL